MDNSNHRCDGRAWAINGHFLTQRMTGVQRSPTKSSPRSMNGLGTIERLGDDRAARLALRLIVPPAADAMSSFARIGICRTRFGSGHACDQFILPFYARSGLLRLGNFGAMVSPKHIVCIHDANVFLCPESYSRAFRLAYCGLLPWVGRRARRVATVSGFFADMLEKYGVCRGKKKDFHRTQRSRTCRALGCDTGAASFARSAGASLRAVVGRQRQAQEHRCRSRAGPGLSMRRGST
jgi:hypothetical protein